MRSSLSLAFLAASFVVGASGCADDPIEQLEALEIASSSNEDVAPVSGRLNVAGSGRDFTLTVTEGDGVHEFRIHSPGESDLQSLDGRMVEVAWRTDTWSSALFVADADGPLYIADGGTGDYFVGTLFGRAPVESGEILAETREGDHRIQYTTLEFASDGGPVALVPGEVETLTLDGATWRAAAVAGWSAKRTSGQTTRCISMLASLSYELLRIDTVVEPRSLVRAPDLDIARHGCAWD